MRYRDEKEGERQREIDAEKERERTIEEREGRAKRRNAKNSILPRPDTFLEGRRRPLGGA